MEKKKSKIYASLALFVLALLVVGATYAYFQNQYGEGSLFDINVTTYTTDLLSFEKGDDINIVADQENFAKGKGNLTGTSFVRAILQANNKTNVATANYSVYLNITKNEFSYTTNDNKAELLLQVVDGFGNSVTNISGLNYVTVVDGSGASISGFDITEKNGLIAIVNNKELNASPRIEEQYNVTLILVNSSFKQNDNADKSLNSKLVIQKNKLNSTLSDYVISQYTGIQGDNNLYYHKSSLENGAGDNSYRYAGYDHDSFYDCLYDDEYVYNENFEIGNTLGDDCNTIYKASYTSGNQYDYFDASFIRSFDEEVTISWDSASSKCVSSNGLNVFSIDTENITQEMCSGKGYFNSGYNMVLGGIELMSGSGIKKLYEEANTVDNYVCFGSDEKTCPNDNLYRIMGIFDGRVKLIKADYVSSNLLGTDGDYKASYSEDSSSYIGDLSISDIGGYMWNYNGLENKTVNDGKGSNTWSTSLLNKINLNTNYLKNIGNKWANMIDTTTWKVGGNIYTNIAESISSVVYQNEVISPVTTNSTDNAIEYSAKIGLMYASDYGFSGNPGLWGSKLVYYSSYNWLYMGLYEWMISRNATTSNYVLGIMTTGSVNAFSSDSAVALRPVFYLLPSVKYLSGTGAKSDPIRIEI